MSDCLIRTYVVNGFLDSGKTTYIEDCIYNDFFYKKGKTLILSFEQGDIEYDITRLKDYRCDVVYYDHGDIRSFITKQIETHLPDRIYVEMNAMLDELYPVIKEELKIVFTTTLIDTDTLSLYATNMRQLLQNMIVESDLVTFNRCNDNKKLEPFAKLFKIMNNKATYFREDPSGYHEKAFGIITPYDLDQDEIVITDQDYAPFYLDALDHPEHYEGKILDLTVQSEINKDSSVFKAGRSVMTCCLADIQFLGFECDNPSSVELAQRMWIKLKAKGKVKEDIYHQKRLVLSALEIEKTAPAENEIIIP